MLPSKASPKTIREAIADAQQGQISMLEGSAEMPLDKASEFAVRVLQEGDIQSVEVSTSGPWLYIKPTEALER